MTARHGIALLIAAALAMPASAAGQACVGLPLQGGKLFLMGSTGFERAGQTYTGAIGVNVVNPLTVVAAYSAHTYEVDRDAKTFSGSGAYEFVWPNVSLCPTAGVSYTTDDFREEEIETRSMIIPIGVGMAHSFSSGELVVTFFTVPQFMYIERESESVEEGNLTITGEVDREFGSTFGFRLGARAWFGGAGMILRSGEDSEALLAVNLGVILGFGPL